jgi:wobble nucleotide-excising tRNase
MGQSLTEISQNLRTATHKRQATAERILDVKVQLIYAFNGTGKTRLSREFKELIAPKEAETDEESGIKVLYYNAFTEDLFYWDNDLDTDVNRKLKIQPNNFTNWVLEEQGQAPNIITNFQYYTNDKLNPRFNERYSTNINGNDIEVKPYSEVTFSIERGNAENIEDIKISKGEESCFIWSVFHSILEQVVEVLNVPETTERETDQFNDLEYVFIDDPVSSLDENHLIELAVDIARLIKSSQSNLKFVLTTHNPLFYNVLHNELKDDRYKKYLLRNLDDGTFELLAQPNDSPFSYHLYLKSEIKKAIETGQLSKYHFNFLRNILEKTSTFLGYQNWGELLPERTPGERDSYLARIINISSHSKHTSEEVFDLTDNDKRVLGFLMDNTKIFEFFKS